MEQTLHHLGQILLGSIPTIVTFTLLHIYLRSVLYRPLSRVLAERKSRTEGQLEAARARLASAEQHLTTYQKALESARVDAYGLIEQRRQVAAREREVLIEQARQEAARTVQVARQQIAEEAADARKRLREESDSLATELLAAILGPAAVSRPTANV